MMKVALSVVTITVLLGIALFCVTPANAVVPTNKLDKDELSVRHRFLEGDDFFFLTDDNFLAVGDENAFIIFMDAKVMFGSATSNFTIDATIEGTDNGLALITDDGSMTFTDDGTIEFASVDRSADVLEIMNPTYKYTMDAFVIAGSTEQCDDFFVAFNTDGSLAGSDDCGFIAGANEDGGFVLTDDALNVTDADGNLTLEADVDVTDDSIAISTDDFAIGANEDGFFFLMDDYLAVGNTNAFITFMETKVMFGSSISGSNFTVDATVKGTDNGLEITTNDGSMIFTNDGTVNFASVDKSADVLEIMNPTYNYTMDAFVIAGSTETCDDFFVAFNTDGSLAGSEDCGFIAGEVEDLEFVATDDKVVVNGEEVDDKCATIPEILCSDNGSDLGLFSIFCGLWEQYNPDPSHDETITVFAPTDEAFTTLYTILFDKDMELDDTTLAEIVGFHVTMGAVMASDLVCGKLLEMSSAGYTRTKCVKDGDEEILTQKGGGNAKNNLPPAIVSSDHNACNGSIVHVVDNVLLPNFIDAL